MKVELIYASDCPNAAEARANLLEAFAAARMEAKWTEWERSSPLSPSYAANFGSPTVLVEGRDVAGESPHDQMSCCRLYPSPGGGYRGAPKVDLMKAAFARAMPPARTTDWKRSLVVPGFIQAMKRSFLAAPGIVVSVLPFGGCPACWPLYGGVLASFGLTFLLSSAYLLPLTAVLLLVSIAIFAFRARARRGYGPFTLGLVAAALILWGKFSLESNTMAYAGIALLIGCSFWNGWPRRAVEPCQQCPR